MTKISIVLTTAAVLACATLAPASGQQQPAPADQGNGNWDPPPVTGPTTRR
jgi:hypothetical protein